MWIRKLFIASATISAAALGAGEASAGYVCSAMLAPGSTSAGSEGYVIVSTSTGANCKGPTLGSHFLCTTGASYALCTSNSAFHYDRQGLLVVFQALVRAAATDQRVTMHPTFCINGSGNCAGAPVFYN
jgi:hypothetical protein